ncbi:MAG: LacI family DNA-binding transcriptional regulator [Ruminococcaceae bacterium]|nr:LacI family DNA-binding transcriptional regulator [Oscillospiraceae bacterium]
MNGKKRPTIYDLAEMTGFSVGTVNRALNGKTRIKEETRRLILETAEKVGYKANPAAQGLHRNPMKIGVVMFCPVFAYVNDIGNGILSAAHDLEKYNVEVVLRQLSYTNSHQCVLDTLDILRTFREEGVSGVVVYHSCASGGEVELLRTEIDGMIEDGIPVCTIANDIPDCKRIFHVGINAYMAGQMAAELLSLTSGGRDVAILTHSRESEVNSKYLKGFFDFAGDDKFSSVHLYEHYDEKELVLRKTERMIGENPNLAGIYMTTASSTDACLHLRQMGKTGFRIITTDLLPETPEILRDGTASAVIFQNPWRQGRNAIRSLYDYLLTKTTTEDHSISPEIIISSNLNAYLL